jgi:hypothetical protein
MARRNRKQGGKNRVENVRIIDPLAGSDGMKVDRQLSAIHSSSNHVQVLCSQYNDFGVTTTEQLANVSWSQIALFDDFVSMSSQFNTYRVRSIRFDIYDIAPASVGSGLFSTFHDQFTVGTQPFFPFADVVDGSDAQYIPPGTGKVSLTWVGHTLNEKGYYDVNPATENTRNDFGGMRLVIPGGPAVPAKYRIITKAIVDFRGRR